MKFCREGDKGLKDVLHGCPKKKRGYEMQLWKAGTAFLPPYALEERKRGACLSSFRWSATGFYEASEAVFGMTGTFRGRKVEAGGGQE